MLTADQLRKKKCMTRSGSEPPMTIENAKSLLSSLPGWSLSENIKYIQKTYIMKGFSEAANLTQKIAEIADKEDHHPNIHLTGYRKLLVELTTHVIQGLSENDFILAAKIEAMPKELKFS